MPVCGHWYCCCKVLLHRATRSLVRCLTEFKLKWHWHFIICIKFMHSFTYTQTHTHSRQLLSLHRKIRSIANCYYHYLIYFWFQYKLNCLFVCVERSRKFGYGHNSFIRSVNVFGVIVTRIMKKNVLIDINQDGIRQ